MTVATDLCNETGQGSVNHEYLWGNFLISVLKGTHSKPKGTHAPSEQFDLLGLFEKPEIDNACCQSKNHKGG